MIAAGEYRYLSPVFNYAPDGTVLALGPAALTSTPGLDGLTDYPAPRCRRLSPRRNHRR